MPMYILTFFVRRYVQPGFARCKFHFEHLTLLSSFFLCPIIRRRTLLGIHRRAIGLKNDTSVDEARPSCDRLFSPLSLGPFSEEPLSIHRCPRRSHSAAFSTDLRLRANDYILSLFYPSSRRRVCGASAAPSGAL